MRAKVHKIPLEIWYLIAGIEDSKSPPCTERPWHEQWNSTLFHYASLPKAEQRAVRGEILEKAKHVESSLRKDECKARMIAEGRLSDPALGH